MSQAYNDLELALLQRAYEVCNDLFAGGSRDPAVRDCIARSVLTLAGSGQKEWEQLANYARSQVCDLLRDRERLQRARSLALNDNFPPLPV
jgi:hypothetical protein